MVVIRPAYLWLLGAGLFAISIFLWVLFWVTALKARGGILGPFDPVGLTCVYLPMLGAVLGFVVPLVFLWRYWNATARKTGVIFACYVLLMLTWAVIDIRHEHYQIGGHSYPHGVLVDGHHYYFHVYNTWYFMPYYWIEHGVRE